MPSSIAAHWRCRRAARARGRSRRRLRARVRRDPANDDPSPRRPSRGVTLGGCKRSMASSRITAVWNPNVKSVEEIVVNRFGHRHGDALGRQRRRDPERVLAADDDQRRSARSSVALVPSRPPSSRVRARRRGSRRLDGSPACASSTHHLAVEHATPSVSEAEDLMAVHTFLADDGTDHRIEAGQSPPPVRTPMRTPPFHCFTSMFFRHVARRDLVTGEALRSQIAASSRTADTDRAALASVTWAARPGVRRRIHRPAPHLLPPPVAGCSCSSAAPARTTRSSRYSPLIDQINPPGRCALLTMYRCSSSW